VIDSLEKARNYSFLLLKFAPRSEWEIRRRLGLKKYTPAVINQTVAFLKSKRFIDDDDFSRAWVQSRLKKPYGLHRIKLELKLKGIDERVVENVCGEVALDYSEDRIVSQIAQEKFRTRHGLDPQKAKQRIFAYLIRRGFSPATVADAIEQL
jgi:regulatory protein